MVPNDGKSIVFSQQTSIYRPGKSHRLMGQSRKWKKYYRNYADLIYISYYLYVYIWIKCKTHLCSFVTNVQGRIMYKWIAIQCYLLCLKVNCRKNNLASWSAKLVAESASHAQISSYNSLSYKIHFLHDPGKRLMYSYSHKEKCTRLLTNCWQKIILTALFCTLCKTIILKMEKKQTRCDIYNCVSLHYIFILK